MSKLVNKMLFIIVAIFCLASTSEVQAAARKTTSHKITTVSPKKTSTYKAPKSSKKSTKKSYKKKAPYEGMGKTSPVTGLPKTKPVNGHVKKTSKGYTYVNPYVKSK